jgi:hypothetical protein
MELKEQCEAAGAEYRGTFQDNYLDGSLVWFHLAQTIYGDREACFAMEAAGWDHRGSYVDGDNQQKTLWRKRTQ